eukprot:2647173-Prorocentrum_lima.AAC.1
MAPPCIGLKGFSALIRIIAPDAWHKSRHVSIPPGQFGRRDCASSAQPWKTFSFGEPTDIRVV